MGNYLPATEQEEKEMLKVVGCESLEDLFRNIPENVKIKNGLNIPEGKAELEVRAIMEKLAAENKVFPAIFRGAGAYKHYIPAIVKSVVSKEEFLTAYTPYQAEISQGILQSIFEYQTMICELTGMDASNASIYDGASAAAEAVAMCRDRKKTKAFISMTSHPDVVDTIKTYCFGNGIELDFIPEKDGMTDVEYIKNHCDKETACVYVQQPNFYGLLEPAEQIGEIVHEAGGKFIMGVNPISLGVIKTPKECGADIAVGEGQPLGLSLAFGGPYLGFMASVSSMMRKLPGRIVGETTDVDGKRGYVLTLQAREQHIRREKAASNVCSNQAHCALTSAVYMASMGSRGIEKAAVQCMSKARYLADKLSEIGYTLVHSSDFFHEFVTVSKAPVEKALKKLEENGILGGLPLSGDRKGQILWCCTEMNTREEMDTLVKLLKEV